MYILAFILFSSLIIWHGRYISLNSKCWWLYVSTAIPSGSSNSHRHGRRLAILLFSSILFSLLSQLHRWLYIFFVLHESLFDWFSQSSLLCCTMLLFMPAIEQIPHFCALGFSPLQSPLLKWDRTSFKIYFYPFAVIMSYWKFGSIENLVLFVW